MSGISIAVGIRGLQAADIDLAEDSDWRGTNVVVAGRVRLNGHRLWLDNLAGIESITDSQEKTCPYGELHIDVPAGVALTNASTRIEGTVKVVKEGEGTFCSSTASPFMGGLRIEAGTVKSLTHGDEVCAHGMLDGDIFVSTNGVFDVNGTSMVGYNFKLARGTIRNSGPPGDMMMPQLIHVSLLDDAQFDFQRDYGIMSGWAVSPTVLDLAGHTLTVSVAEGSNFFVSATTVTGAGVLRVVGPGTFCPCLGNVMIEEAKLVTECRINLEAEVHTNGYESDIVGVGPWRLGGVIVFGTFKPRGDFDWVELDDGATIDLTERTTPLQWTPDKELLFANNATIYIDVGELHGRQWAIDWKDLYYTPYYLATTTFKPVPDARYRLLVVLDKGIRILQPGFVITFR